jgi:hypothetical protein
VNTALWDTVMYSFVDRDPELLLEHKDEIRDAFYQLLTDGSLPKKLMTATPKVSLNWVAHLTVSCSLASERRRANSRTNQ